MKYLFIFCLIIISCKNNQIKEEKNIISIDKFSKILIDLMLVDTYNKQTLFRLKNINNYNTDSLYRIEFNTILYKYNIQKSIFDKSYKYYFSNPEKLKEVNKILNNENKKF